MYLFLSNWLSFYCAFSVEPCIYYAVSLIDIDFRRGEKLYYKSSLNKTILKYFIPHSTFLIVQSEPALSFRAISQQASLSWPRYEFPSRLGLLPVENIESIINPSNTNPIPQGALTPHSHHNTALQTPNLSEEHVGSRCRWARASYGTID